MKGIHSITKAKKNDQIPETSMQPQHLSFDGIHWFHPTQQRRNKKSYKN